MEHLRSIGVFVRCVELQSFAACATALGLSPSAVSKSISALERSLGVRLLARSSRGISLTSEGSRFYERCRTVVAELEAAEREAASSRDLPRGRLRVVAHPTPARARLLRELPRFLRMYPDLSVELNVTQGARSLESEAIDVGLFLGDPPDTRLIARRIADLRFITLASREYLTKHGTPQAPGELTSHRCVCYLRPDGLAHNVWLFQRGGETTEIKVRSDYCVNDGEGLLDAARAGLGIVRATTLIAESGYPVPDLVPLFIDWYAEAPPLHVVYTRGRTVPPKVRVFVDFVTGLFGDLRHSAPAEREPRLWPMRRG